MPKRKPSKSTSPRHGHHSRNSSKKSVSNIVSPSSPFVSAASEKKSRRGLKIVKCEKDDQHEEHVIKVKIEDHEDHEYHEEHEEHEEHEDGKDDGSVSSTEDDSDTVEKYSNNRQLLIQRIKCIGKHELSREQRKAVYKIMSRSELLNGNGNGNDNDNTNSNTSNLIRITAAAGTGKTTTLLKLAEAASLLGHNNITYVTFNKAAAHDVNERRRRQNGLGGVYVNLNAHTLHSCAMRLLQKENGNGEDDGGVKLITNDRKMERIIWDMCRTEIEIFLKRCYRNIDRKYGDNRAKASGKKHYAEKKVLFFLYKTLRNFCTSKLSYEELGDSSTFNRVYYPAKLFHNRNDKVQNNGCFEGYGNAEGWYADTIHALWPKLKQRGVRSFDIEMKTAQLNKLQIPGTCILLDECQDCDACQIDWVSHQVKYGGKQVVLVGDAAQTIYGFRGAKSKFMMELENAVDLTLTKSWRFGPAIARIANVVLFAKEMSPQTTGRYPMWKPYRVRGIDTVLDLVTSSNIARGWKQGQVTVIAWTNATLFQKAIELLTNHSNEKANVDVDSIDVSKMPKIHINGRGQDSGMNKMKDMEKQIVQLFQMYMASHEGGEARPYQLDTKIFPEFDFEVTWNEFRNHMNALELTKYAASTSVVATFGKDTIKAMDFFKTWVSSKKYTAEEADIILSTVHSAKGMEWDRVQLCEDFGFQMKLKHCSESNAWQFDLKNWGDEVNMLYVACTRAKRLLSIPEFFVSFLRDCDTLHKFKLTGDEGELKSCFGFSSTDKAETLWSEIVSKLRAEHRLGDDDIITKAFLNGDDHSNDNDSSSDDDIIEVW